MCCISPSAIIYLPHDCQSFAMNTCAESLGPGRYTTGTYVGLIAGLATATTLAGADLARRFLRHVRGLLERLPMSGADRAFIENLGSMLERRRYGDATIRQYVACTARFLSWCYLTHRAVDSCAVLDFLGLPHHGRRLATAVRRLHLSALRTVFDRCCGQHLTAGIGYAPRPPKVRSATPAEIRALLDHAAPRNRIVVTLCSTLGLRPREIVAIRWRDVNLRRARIRIARGRRGAIYHLTLPRQLVQALRQHGAERAENDQMQHVFAGQTTGHGLSVRAVQLALSQLCRKAGVHITLTQLAAAASIPPVQRPGNPSPSWTRKPHLECVTASPHHAPRGPPMAQPTGN